MAKKRAYIFAGLILSLALLEVCLRLLLCITTGASFIRPSTAIYKYYPELKPIEQAQVSNTDSTLDILILSCSVLHKEWADIETEMQHCIQLPPGYKQLKIYNASGIGHGSRDNYLKYSLLADKHFDLVMYYDAINDSRLNNCPPQIFKADYSHYLWYDEINHILQHTEIDYTVIPFFCDWVRIKLKALFNKNAYVPAHYSLRNEWLQYGSDYKSLTCYHQNLQQVMDMAQQRGARFVYFTFAYYLPANYSLQGFLNKNLDYTFCDHSRETEIWGEPKNVSGFINTINAYSHKWVSQYNNACWVDLGRNYPAEGIYFADICHFSPQGIHLFAAMACNGLDSALVRH